VQTLNQPQYAPWPMEEQVIAIYAGIHGHLDDIPVAQVPRFQEELREQLRSEGGLYERIREEKDLSDELASDIEEAVKKFKDTFAVHEETGIVGTAA
jgi:F-type H+-transporting ATPase subunit alpha